MVDVQFKGLHDAVISRIPLLEHNNTIGPNGAIPVDLAVRREGVTKALSIYGYVSGIGRDPVILAHQGENIKAKFIASHINMSARFSHYFDTSTLSPRPMAKVWAAERLVGIEN